MLDKFYSHRILLQLLFFNLSHKSDNCLFYEIVNHFVFDVKCLRSLQFYT